MKPLKKFVGLTAVAVPLALLVGCGDMDEPFEPADQPDMQQQEQQQQDWLPPTEEAPPPEGGMEAPPAEDGMGAPRSPEGDMPAASDTGDAMPEAPDEANDNR